MKVFAPTTDVLHAHEHHKSRAAIHGEFAPIYMMLGMLAVALSIGAHTAKQQLVHSPTVFVNKKKRETVPEVDDPDVVIGSADKFVNKSFLRKVAHIQDHNYTLPDPARPDPFTRSRDVETLKTVGVEPGGH
ncbi:unnamed protein product [Ilex paraguariensis]|uniref:Uncharacterized protein n=1 Tax=Ilex paraguariensis TaxID=185542 RepID=A0ABC8UAV1_9AQUA